MDRQQELMENVLRLCRVMHRNTANSPRISHGGYRVTNAVMANEGIRILDLAKVLGIRPSSLTNSLKKLEEDGYIYRVQDERDSRSYHIYTTEKTHQEHDVWVKEQAVRSEKMSILTDEEASMFCILCDKLCTHLETISESDSAAE